MLSSPIRAVPATDGSSNAWGFTIPKPRKAAKICVSIGSGWPTGRPRVRSFRLRRLASSSSLASSSRPPDRSHGGPPENLVVMGRMTAPFGIKGWIKLQPFTAAPENLQAYSHWWIGAAGQWQEYRVEGMEVHSAAVVVKLAGCEDRDAAALFRGREVAVPRDALPETAANEYYWSDLIGLKVV